MATLGYNPSCTIDTPKFHGVMRYHFVTGTGEVKGHNFNCPMTETGAYRCDGLDYVDVFLARNPDKYLWNKPIMRMRLWQPEYFCDSLNPEVRDYWNGKMWHEHMFAYRGMVHIDSAWRPLVPQPLAQATSMTLMRDENGDVSLPRFVIPDELGAVQNVPEVNVPRNRFTDFILQKMGLKE